MDQQRRAKYETLIQETKSEIENIEIRIDEELAKVKETLAALENEKKAQLTIYGGFCQLLGVPNDLEEDEEIEEL